MVISPWYRRPRQAELERYENSYWLCDIRDPEEIIVELAEKIG